MVVLDAVSSWSFDLTQFDSVWKLVINVFLLLVALLLGNALRRVVPFLRKAFIPSALIGGLFLFLIALFSDKVLHYTLVDKRIMQIITYHALAVGFIAMSLKTAEKGKKATVLQSFQNGALTGATYMLQAILGIGVSLLFFWLGIEKFYDAGVILPLGFGQGPGNALTWDLKFSENPSIDFTGGGSFGLTIASVGFIVASIFGVLYINIFKAKGEIVEKERLLDRRVEEFVTPTDIDDNESVDKTSIQVAFVGLSYLIAFGIMIFFAKLTDWTGVGLFNSVAWGFNFIWGVIAATLVKMAVNFFYNKGVCKRRYINNYQMDRISGFAFDIMIIAGVAAIDIEVVMRYLGLIVALCAVGTLATFFYIFFISRRVFPNNRHEIFLVNYGALTGTASNGMILLREIDPNFETPVSNIYIVSQFPAMIFVAPLLVLLEFSGATLTKCLIALGIFAALFTGYTLFLVLSSRQKKEKEVTE